MIKGIMLIAFAFVLNLPFASAQKTENTNECKTFKECDRNRDRFISQDECMNNAFQMFDKNQDGKLSRNEYRKMIKYDRQNKAAVMNQDKNKSKNQINQPQNKPIQQQKPNTYQKKKSKGN